MVNANSFYTYAQALRMYRTHGVRVPVALSPAVLRKVRAQGAVRRAGLAELAVTALPYLMRGTFQSDTEFQNELNAMRVDAHTTQVQVEVHA